MYRPQTAAEINLFRIERTLKKLERGEITVSDCKLNTRFDRLLKVNIIQSFHLVFKLYIYETL